MMIRLISKHTRWGGWRKCSHSHPLKYSKSIAHDEGSLFDAASFVVDNDLAQSPSQRTLLNAYTGVDDAELRSFVQDMHRRVFLENVEIDSAEVDADVEFLTQAFSISGDEAVVLKLYVAALLQFPDVLFY